MPTQLQIKIKGMHCGGCETVIEEAVSNLNGVLKVKANYADSLCNIEFDSKTINPELIYKTIEDSGYQVDLTPAPKDNIFFKVFLSLLALAGIILLMFLSRKLWHQYSIPEINSQLSYGMVFIVGLITGLHCIGMCGSFVLSYTLKKTQEGASPYLSHFLYGLGKTLSYAMFGAFFGYLGSIISITPFISGVSILLAGCFLVLFGMNMLDLFAVLKRVRFKQPVAITQFAINKRRSSSNPFFIGFFTGFILGCGPLQAMYVMAAGNGDPIEGAKFLTAFGLGTLPALLGFGMVAHLLSDKMTHRFLQASGIILIIIGAMMLNKGLIKTKSGYDFNSIKSSLILNYEKQFPD